MWLQQVIVVQELFQRRGMGDCADMGVAMQLCGKTLGLIGMGANGKLLHILAAVC